MNLKRLYYRWRLARLRDRLQGLREDRWTYQTIADIRGPSHPFHQRVAGLAAEIARTEARILKIEPKT